MKISDCFLCDPRRELVFAESSNFRALLGLGPIVEGYSLIATKDHVPSMFDLDDHLAKEFREFSAQVTEIISRLWGPPVITEHGRIGLCIKKQRRHESHCMHAHQLLFPGVPPFDNCMEASLIEPIIADGFESARRMASHLTEYLYYEAPGGRVLIGNAPAHLRRQFFRAGAANAIGRPEFQSWNEHPRLDVVASAQSRLGLTTNVS